MLWYYQNLPNMEEGKYTHLTTLLRQICSSSCLLQHVQPPKTTFKEYQMATQFEETVQASGTDLIGMLELSDPTFQKTMIKKIITMINILRMLMDKIDSMKKQTGNK